MKAGSLEIRHNIYPRFVLTTSLDGVQTPQGDRSSFWKIFTIYFPVLSNNFLRRQLASNPSSSRWHTISYMILLKIEVQSA